jgi:hypothetical protein
MFILNQLFLAAFFASKKSDYGGALGFLTKGTT